MAVDIRTLADLSEDDLTILKGLLDTGAATPTDLAVRLRRMTEDVEPHLKKLRTKGLVDVKERDAGIEREIYRVSRSGQSLLTP